MNNKKRIMFISIIAILIAIIGLYSTYAINVYEEETKMTNFDESFNFDLFGNNTREMIIPAGKTKLLDIDITNPHNDTIQYGVAYSLNNSTSLPSGVTIAQASTSEDPTTGIVTATDTVSVSIIVVNESTESVTLSFSVTTGYKNGGDLIVPTEKVLVDGIYDVVPVTAAEKIIKLSQGNYWESGASGVFGTNCESDAEDAYCNEYRYVGAEVDNYVLFNNDLYRVIGVFDENSHGVPGEYLVKLIAANLLSANSYGAYNSSATSGTYSNYKNDWSGTTTGVAANTNVLLNQFFYNKTKEVTGYSNCTTWTYFYSDTNSKTNDCSDIVGYGIDASVRDYIEEVTWYLKGYSSTSFNKQAFYTCERSEDTVITSCTSGNKGGYANSTKGYIGLMYASDYVYASSYYSSTDTTNVGTGYHGNKNWLYKGHEWTITPDGDSARNAFRVSSYGRLDSSNTYAGYGVRPALYLKSSVSINGGEGTIENPFTLSM